MLAQALARTGARDEAREQQAEIQRINAIRAAMGRALVLLEGACRRTRAGDPAGRSRACGRPLRSARHWRRRSFRLGAALRHSSGHTAEAEAALREAVRLDPDDARATSSDLRAPAPATCKARHSRCAARRCLRRAWWPRSASSRRWRDASRTGPASPAGVRGGARLESRGRAGQERAAGSERAPVFAAAGGSPMTPDWPARRAGTPGRGRRRLLTHDRPVAILLVALLAISLAQGVLLGQMATAERVEAPGWWPTKGTAARQEYAGPDACAACHTSRAASQQLTAMAGTARRAADDSRILSGSTPLSVRLGGFSYTIARGGPAPTYTVSDGTRSVSGTRLGVWGRQGRTDVSIRR